MIKKFVNQELTINCNYCGQDYVETIPMDFEFEWSEEFSSYSPKGYHCLNCSSKGVGVVYFVNPNVPESDFDEFEEEATGEVSLEEINAKKYLRDFIWLHRPDLKGLDRAAYNRERAHIVQDVLQKYQGTDRIVF